MDMMTNQGEIPSSGAVATHQMFLKTGKTRAAIGSDVNEHACDKSSGRTGDQTETCNCKSHQWCRRPKGHYVK